VAIIRMPRYRYGIKGENNGGKGRFLVGLIVVIRRKKFTLQIILF